MALIFASDVTRTSRCNVWLFRVPSPTTSAGSISTLAVLLGFQFFLKWLEKSRVPIQTDITVIIVINVPLSF